ncbi:MAG: Epoxyqueuosine reductase [Candidatus Lokiarchaeum sp. GC14_75]|nr:MAG: Epoxyqueuosine reductase [Candidatus Lokiarchaeum sp. GC14_75]
MVINKEWFVSKINNFLLNDESNKMVKVDGSLIFQPETLVGFSSGNDPIFTKYKDIIGNFHLTPVEAFTKFYENTNIKFTAENLSVVAYVLPISEETKEENYQHSKNMPSERWANTRLYGEESNQKLQNYLVNELKKENVNAVAPIIEKDLFKIFRKHEKGVWASTWSHRHMLFASGLGSFGISDGFINARGKAMRCGSLIVDYKLPSDAKNRPNDPYEFCIKCGECVERCPAGAISLEEYHNKQICSGHVFSAIPYVKKNYGINIYGCGLCQVHVSCSSGIPNKKNS